MAGRCCSAARTESCILVFACKDFRSVTLFVCGKRVLLLVQCCQHIVADSLLLLSYVCPAVCIAGFGRASLNATFCSMCPPGQYQPGGLLYCLPCPNATFYAPVDGAGDQWSSAGLTTFLGAVGASCIPKESQLSPEAGQAYFGKDPEVQALLTNSTKQTLGACLSSCPSDACCLAQYEVTDRQCRTATLPAVAADAAGYYRLMYKLPPSAMGSASSVKPDAAPAGGNSSEAVKGKMISSGIYARCNIPTTTTENWGNIDVQPAGG